MVRKPKGTSSLTPPLSATFVERSVKFEEEPIPDFELAPGKCSSPQPFEDVSDDTCYIFSDMSDINMSKHDIFVYDSPSRPKCGEKSFKL